MLHRNRHRNRQLARLIRASGRSIQEIATLAGCHRNVVGYLLASRFSTTRATAEALAKALNTSVDALGVEVNDRHSNRNDY